MLLTLYPRLLRPLAEVPRHYRKGIQAAVFWGLVNQTEE